jgi:rhamnosyltransferase subunit B
MMHAVLACFGSDGDVFPFVGIGEVLQKRGHCVTLVANAHYDRLAAAHGFGFRALGTNQETEALLNDPNSWHPFKSLRVGHRWAVNGLGRHYSVLAELARDEETVLIASPVIFAARVVQEKLSRPLATILLQPWLIRSISAPPVMPAGLSLPAEAPRLLRSSYSKMLDVVVDFLLGSHINRLRASIGLKSARRILDWCFSPDLVIGLFPGAFGEPQADWPPNIRLAGFPTYDAGPQTSLPADLLQFCRAGKPPIAVTFGTGMRHAAKVFHAASEALSILGWPGIFLTRHAGQIPAPLPRSIRHVEFASFRELFPHCGAVIHHGGIGTSAKALMAGTPQLVIPFAYDQKDNAARLKRIGAGDWIRSPQADGPTIAAGLRKLMSSAPSREQISLQFNHADGAQRAVQWIEEFVQHSTVEPLNF